MRAPHYAEGLFFQFQFLYGVKNFGLMTQVVFNLITEICVCCIFIQIFACAEFYYHWGDARLYDDAYLNALLSTFQQMHDAAACLRLVATLARRCEWSACWESFDFVELLGLCWLPRSFYGSGVTPAILGRRAQLKILSTCEQTAPAGAMKFIPVLTCVVEVIDLWKEIFTVPTTILETFQHIELPQVIDDPAAYYVYFTHLIKLGEFLFNRPVCLDTAPVAFDELDAIDQAACEVVQQLFDNMLSLVISGDDAELALGECFWVLLMCWHYKDLPLYHQLCQLFANVTYQPQHNKLFLSIFFFSQLLFQIFAATSTLIGVSIKLSGKIGVRGISRTRGLRAMCGSTSFTVGYTQRVRYLSGVITADGGVLGLKILLRYF